MKVFDTWMCGCAHIKYKHKHPQHEFIALTDLNSSHLPFPVHLLLKTFEVYEKNVWEFIKLELLVGVALHAINAIAILS